MGDESQAPAIFNGKRKLVEKPVKTIHQRWMCPKPKCKGEMKHTGATWGARGFMHRCGACEQVLVIMGATYPRIVYI